MSEENRIRDDLHYVRSVVDRAGRARNPAAIYFLWAVISFFGYAIIDYDPEKTGAYWAVAGPLGGVLSAILGIRGARRAGQVSEREGVQELLHWSGLFVAILLLVPFVMRGHSPPEELPRIILLLVALAYWTSGVHRDRRLLPVAGAMAALFLFSVVAPDTPWLWTITGAAMAGSLGAAGAIAAARARRAG